MVTIDVDYMGDKEDAKHESEMFGIKIVVMKTMTKLMLVVQKLMFLIG